MEKMCFQKLMLKFYNEIIKMERKKQLLEAKLKKENRKTL